MVDFDHTHDNGSGQISQTEETPKTPLQWQKHWVGEFAASDRMLRTFHRRAHRVVNRYLDERQGSNEDHFQNRASSLNLFNANTQTMLGIMYGQLPKVDVSREYGDANDDPARVASLMMGRILNNCVADPGDDYTALLKDVLEDRLVPGLGCARVRYEYDSVETEVPPMMGFDPLTGMEEEVAPGYTTEELSDERCPTTYVHWQDLKWSYTRTWSEMRWIAFRAFMDHAAVKARFGEEVADQVNYLNVKPQGTKDGATADTDFQNPKPLAEIWEIWNKETKKVHWYCESCDKQLEEKDDPLQLAGFWPCPPFLAANVSTSLLMPKPDYMMAQDLYEEIDTLTSRIQIITDAVKVVGVYDKNSGEIERLFTEAVENELIPVENWAMFAERGGVAGAIDWLPVEAVVNTLNTLRQIRDETIQLLYQVTGMSDIMRGQTEQYTSASSDKLAAKYGSSRMQKLQESFADFASSLMRLKAELVSKHYDPETIVQQSNIMASPDGQNPELLQQAIALIKDPSMLQWRINVRPESIAMIDYAQMQAERTEYLSAVSGFMSSSTPLMQQMPAATPFLMEMLKWGLAGFKGANEIEGVLDQALNAAKEAEAQKQQAPPQPNPEQMKAQMEMQKLQMQMQLEQTKHQNVMQAQQANNQSDLQEIMANLKAKMQEIQAGTDASIREEEAQAAFNIAELQMKGTLDDAKHENQMELERAKAIYSRESDGKAD